MRAERRDEIDDLTLARARRGERQALGQVVERYQGRVFALLQRMLLRGPVEVEDVAQEVFVKVVRHLPSFDPAGPAPLSSWILTIATRSAIDAIRRERPRGEAPEPILDGVQAGEDRALARAAAEAILSLPADHRAVLVLRAYHDLDYPEIAAILEIEVGTVKSRLSRARAELRARLSGGTHD